MNGPDWSALLATVNVETLISGLLAVASIYLSCLVLVKGLKLIFALFFYDMETDRLWDEWNNAGPIHRIRMREEGRDPRDR